MTQTIEAVFDGTVLRPNQPLPFTPPTREGLNAYVLTTDEHFRQMGFQVLMQELPAGINNYSHSQ